MGPNKMAGSIRAIITALIAKPAFAAEPESGRDEGGHGDEPHPVPQRGDAHRREQARERRVGEQILQGRRTGSAECRDLVGDGSHGA